MPTCGTASERSSARVQEPGWVGTRPAETSGVVIESSSWLLATDRGGHRIRARAARRHLSANVLEPSPTEHNDVRLRPASEPPEAPPSDCFRPPLADRSDKSVPMIVWNRPLSELREGVVAELLEPLSQVSPEYFETIVLDLLHRMGYGASRADLRRVGRSATVASTASSRLTALGSRRCTSRRSAGRVRSAVPNSGLLRRVGGPEGQQGRVHHDRHFHPQAMDFAGSVERIVLVDGSARRPHDRT